MTAVCGPCSKILQGIFFITRFFDHEKLILPIECLSPIAL